MRITFINSNLDCTIKNDKSFVNRLLCGDNLDILAKIPKESIDLIYIDPPFFTNKQYEVVYGTNAERRGFSDKWKGGIEQYIEWLKQRVQLMYETLRPTGSFYLHCDWHANAHIRIMLDQIFGYKNFQNEIIWHYGLGGSSPKRFPRKHDTILFYTKTNDYKFYPEMVPASSQKMKGQFKKVDDVWDIPSINNMAKERTGYPTQKPEKLLERIIKASSSEGDVVADFFCGSGTTLVVAQRLNRRWIGIDISPAAIKLAEERLKGG